jgi:hypothetical protein
VTGCLNDVPLSFAFEGKKFSISLFEFDALLGIDREGVCIEPDGEKGRH